MWQRRVQDAPVIREGMSINMEGNTGAMAFVIGKTVNAREMVIKLYLNPPNVVLVRIECRGTLITK